jgi:hypothetical protein
LASTLLNRDLGRGVFYLDSIAGGGDGACPREAPLPTVGGAKLEGEDVRREPAAAVRSSAWMTVRGSAEKQLQTPGTVRTTTSMDFLVE